MEYNTETHQSGSLFVQQKKNVPGTIRKYGSMHESVDIGNFELGLYVDIVDFLN